MEEWARSGVDIVKKEIEYVCGCCGNDFEDDLQMFWVHVER